MILLNLLVDLSVILLPISTYIAWRYGLKRSYLEFYREELFVLRFKLYRLALNDKISCHDKNYRELERFINLNIRYAHKLTTLSIIASNYILNSFKKPSKLPSSSETVEFDDTVLSELKEIESTVKKRSLWFVKRYSPPFYILSFFYFIRYLIAVVASNHINIFKQLKKGLRKKITAKKSSIDIELINRDLEFEKGNDLSKSTQNQTVSQFQ